jgi:hypothetical protein
VASEAALGSHFQQAGTAQDLEVVGQGRHADGDIEVAAT